MATIRRRGTKWQVQVRRKGRKPLSRTFSQKQDALVWARRKEREADLGEPIDGPTEPCGTLADIVTRYLNEITPRHRGHESETLFLKAFLRHAISSKKVAELTTADFASYRDERLLTVKPATVKRQLVPIRHMFNIAKSEWGIPMRENPLDSLKLDSLDQRRERRLREGEFERLIEAAGSCRNPYAVSIIRLAVETGMRRGELLAIRWEHIDAENRLLFIPHTKNGHSRSIPLSQSALRLLQSLTATGDEVFPVTANAFRLCWERLKRRAKIDDLRFHDLRHEAISRFFEMGMTVPEVALISGHRDMQMLFRYAHPIARAVFEKLDK